MRNVAEGADVVILLLEMLTVGDHCRCLRVDMQRCFSSWRIADPSFVVAGRRTPRLWSMFDVGCRSVDSAVGVVSGTL